MLPEQGVCYKPCLTEDDGGWSVCRDRENTLQKVLGSCLANTEMRALKRETFTDSRESK